MDSKLHTFLTLCQTMNYRLAAEHLHLSQPAVTKQIQSLEQMLQVSCFDMTDILCIKQRRAGCWNGMLSQCSINLKNCSWPLRIRAA